MQEHDVKAKLAEFWIDVDYELPPVDHFVLLSFANLTLPQVGRYEEDEDGGGNFYVGDNDTPLIKYGIFVNAWMPLPDCMEG